MNTKEKAKPLQKAPKTGGEVLLYHGTTVKFDKFDDTFTNKHGFLGQGHYFTPSKEYAKTYGKIVKETFLDEGLKIYNSKAKSSGEILTELKQKYSGLDEFNIRDILEKKGYNGIQYTDWDRGDIINIFRSKDIPLNEKIF